MDVDDDPYGRPSAIPAGYAAQPGAYPHTSGVYTLDRDPRELGRPAVQMVDRHGQPIPQSAYPQEQAGYTYGTQASGLPQRMQPGYNDVPRSMIPGGRTPPQDLRSVQPDYGTAGYPVTTQVTRAPISTYDSRASIQATAYAYPERDARPIDRHRTRR